MLGSSWVDPKILLTICAVLVGPALEAHGAGEKRRPAHETSDAASDSSTLATEEPALEGVREPERIADPRRKTVAYDLVKVGQNVHVHSDEVVRGDVVLLGGDLRVDGEIVGGAVVLGGDLRAGPEAVIGGQAVAVGGRVDTAAGANVRGGVVSLSFLPAPLFRNFGGDRAEEIATVLGDLFELAALLVVAALVLVFGSRRVQVTCSHLDDGFLKCFGLGILGLTGGLFAVTVIVVLLAITLLGIPVALTLALATFVLLAIALVAGALQLGGHVATALRMPTHGPWRRMLLGVGTLFLPQISADLLRWVVGPLPVAVALQLLHGALVLVVTSAGLGAIALSRLGSVPSHPLPHPRDDSGAISRGESSDYRPFHESEAPTR